MTYKDKFKVMNRMYDDVWVHTEKPVWIVHYPIQKMYQVFKVKDYELPVRKHKKLWAHDNELIGKDYKTLDAAMEAHV